MELEFLPDGSTDCPLLILSPSVPEEAKLLYNAINEMISVPAANLDVTTLDIHTLPFISPIEDCKLTAQIGEDDLGVIPINTLEVFLSETRNHFNWKLTLKSWNFVLALLHSFTIPDSVGGYQWLDETSQISVLISRYYRWW